jgi:hypothetical protein
VAASGGGEENGPGVREIKGERGSPLLERRPRGGGVSWDSPIVN